MSNEAGRRCIQCTFSPFDYQKISGNSDLWLPFGIFIPEFYAHVRKCIAPRIEVAQQLFRCIKKEASEAKLHSPFFLVDDEQSGRVFLRAAAISRVVSDGVACKEKYPANAALVGKSSNLFSSPLARIFRLFIFHSSRRFLKDVFPLRTYKSTSALEYKKYVYHPKHRHPLQRNAVA